MKRNNKLVAVYPTDEERAMLEAIAKGFGVGLSGTVRRMIKLFYTLGK